MDIKILRTADPKILIPVEVYKKMAIYGELMKGDEISWLGFVERLSMFEFRINDVFLCKQEVSTAYTEMSIEGQTERINEFLDAGMDPKEVSNIRFHGHWHPHNSTSPSSTDETQLKEFMESVKDYFIRVIGTPKGEYEYTVSLMDVGIEIKGVPWELDIPVNLDQIRSEAAAEIKQFVSKKTYTYNQGAEGGYTKYGQVGWQGGDYRSSPGYMSYLEKLDKEDRKELEAKGKCYSSNYNSTLEELGTRYGKKQKKLKIEKYVKTEKDGHKQMGFGVITDEFGGE